MLYQRATYENGVIKILESKIIDQNKLTSECWLIQFEGAAACEKCEYKNKPRLCGGMNIRKRLGVPEPVKKNKKNRSRGIIPALGKNTIPL